MKRAVVLGAAGQDGSLLSEELAASGRAVLGLGRGPAYPWPAPSGRFEYRALDLRDARALAGCLEGFEPDEVYHVAAVHGSAGFTYEEVWADALAVNTGALHTVLEHARRRNPAMHVFYASSCKIFGGAMRGAVDLDTPRDGKCLYSITKKASGALAEHYRAAHGLRVTVGILFNHESERRPPGFFIPKVCRILQAALSDPSHREHVHTLGFCCDWSAADDFMRMAVRAADRGHSGDLIFASGETWNGREFVRELFARHGLDYRQHVIEDAPGEGEAFSADAGTAWRALDFRPSRHIFAVCSALVGHGGGPASSCI